MADKWYDKSAVQTAALLGTDLKSGLNREAVRHRRRLDGENDIYPTPKKSYKKYLLHLLTDYTSLLMLVTLLIAAVFRETENLLLMAAILVTYYVIVMATYIKSQQVLDDMGKGALPNAKVLREGRIFMVKQKQLVRGDIIYISAGDIVPCDARLIESDELEVMEANVTGVTHTVRKNARFEEYHDIAPAKQRNMLFASSIVTRGTARAVCCEIGEETLLCKMGKNQPLVSHERLHLFDRIGGFCKTWTLFMTSMILILTVTELLIGTMADRGIYDSFMTGISLAVASMSEFYTAFGYIVLACGIFGAVNRQKEVNRGALIKNSAKLEDLKNLTCLIVPKEAAFHVRDMSLGKVYANGDTFSPGERGFRRNSARVLRYALISTGRYGAGRLIESNNARDNIYSSEEEAILKAAEDCAEYNIGLEQRYPMLQHLGKSGDCPFETTLVRYQSAFVVSLRGDYRQILPRCRDYTEDGRIHRMTDEKRNELYITAERMERESYRVIAVASKDTPYNNLKRLSAAHTDLTLEGFLAIKEPVLPNAAKNVLRCQNAGLKVILLSSDVSRNNRILAASLGIAASEDGVVTGAELSGMKEGMIRANLDRYTVYEGLTLPQKRLIVRFLQEQGEKVGYLCSELDEIILMKDADVGFSRSVTLSDRAGGSGVDLSHHNIPLYVKNADDVSTGCEALKFVSDVIVSEPDTSGTGGFNAIVDSLLCAKAVYYNLHRMLRYMISSQLCKLLLVFAAIFLGVTALTPPQILFLGLVVDFAAMIIIAFEKPEHTLLKAPAKIGDKLERPIRGNPESLLYGVLLAAVILLSCRFLVECGYLSEELQNAFCFFSLLLSQIALLMESKRETSIFARGARFSGAFAILLTVLLFFLLFAFTLPSFGGWFGLSPLPTAAMLAAFAPPFLLILFFELGKLFGRTREKNKQKSHTAES